MVVDVFFLISFDIYVIIFLSDLVFVSLYKIAFILRYR